MDIIALDLSYMPRAHTGHLVGSKPIVNLIKQIDSKYTMTKILQFGFNTGWSAALFLSLTDANVTSLEILRVDQAEKAVEILDERFPDRHSIFWGDSMETANSVYAGKLSIGKFDFAFIDGGHTPNVVESDIRLSRHLGVKHMIFDDARHENIKPAIDKFDFELICETKYPPIKFKNKTYRARNPREIWLSMYTLKD
jgi:predicted O-methyltransferase YrrM